MASTRAVLQVFEKYQKDRVAFVQTVAELATRPQNIEPMQSAGVMALLRPLLLDNVPRCVERDGVETRDPGHSPPKNGTARASSSPRPPDSFPRWRSSRADRPLSRSRVLAPPRLPPHERSIQQSAAIALGRLANYSDHLAEAVVSNEILPQLVYSLSEQNRFYKQAAAFVLRAVAKHSPPLAQAVVDSGALDALVQCLEEFDPGVKESAAWALGYIAGHNADLASVVVEAGAVPLLVLCVQEPELSLKRIAASSLSDIAKHSPELAQAVVDAGAVAYLAPLVVSPDAKLKRQVCAALGQVAKHSVDLAETVVEAEVFPAILACLKDVDGFVRKHAATAIREVAKHTPELAQLIVSNGGVAALVDYVEESESGNRLPGVMALGYIDAGALGRLVAVGASRRASDDLRSKCARSLRFIIEKLTDLRALDRTLQEPGLPPEVCKFVVHQISKVLPNDPQGRHDFVASGGLAACQALDARSGSALKEYVDVIKSCYPEEIVRYYSPTYGTELLEKLEVTA